LHKRRNALTRFYTEIPAYVFCLPSTEKNKDMEGNKNQTTSESTGKIAKNRGSKFKKWAEE